MFKRSSSESSETTTPAAPGKKNRPTPTRKEAEAAARARAKAPRTRRELAEAQKRQRRTNQDKMRNALKTGDERYLPERDRGPVKRFVRDFVDARFSIIEMVVPLLVISLVLGYLSPDLAAAGSLILMATVLFVIVDLIVLRFRLHKALKARFPDRSLKGTTYYGLLRAMQMKFMRLPKARVKIGQELPGDYDR